MLLEKLGQVVVLFVGQNNREVTAHNNLNLRVNGPDALNKPPKIIVHFGCAAREVNGLELVFFQHVKTFLHRFLGHYFFAVGASVHVAMATNLVAHLAHIHLKDVNLRGFERKQAKRCYFFSKQRQVPPHFVVVVQYLDLVAAVAKFVFEGFERFYWVHRSVVVVL